MDELGQLGRRAAATRKRTRVKTRTLLSDLASTEQQMDEVVALTAQEGRDLGSSRQGMVTDACMCRKTATKRESTFAASGLAKERGTRARARLSTCMKVCSPASQRQEATTISRASPTLSET
eukprot:6201427-Pleurochrysis_carterae.AAC.2